MVGALACTHVLFDRPGALEMRDAAVALGSVDRLINDLLHARVPGGLGDRLALAHPAQPSYLASQVSKYSRRLLEAVLTDRDLGSSTTLS